MITVLGHSYTADDARGTLAALGPWWDQLTSGRDTSSLGSLGRDLANLLADALGEPSPEGEPTEIITALGSRAREGVGQAGLDGPALAGLLEAALGHLAEAGERLRRAGALPPTATGTVVRLNHSDGGVPKRPTAEVTVDRRGIVGDRQATRKHHGRPWQALCLWSAEVIDDLAAQGHPIGYGSAGENVTIGGLDWAQVRSGVRLRLGEVVAEVTVFSLPCSKNAQWFADRDFNRLHHDRGPVSRVYAWVREPGRIVTGDPVVLEPA